jgi:hypothetical protein
VWGQRWARRKVEEGDLDAPLLMWDIQRCVRPNDLPDRRVTVAVTFTDVRSAHCRSWLVLFQGAVDLCLTDPGFDVDVHITTDLLTMTRVWLGDISVGDAVRSNTMTLTGRTALVRSLPKWIAVIPQSEGIGRSSTKPPSSLSRSGRRPNTSSGREGRSCRNAITMAAVMMTIRLLAHAHPLDESRQ